MLYSYVINIFLQIFKAIKMFQSSLYANDFKDQQLQKQLFINVFQYSDEIQIVFVDDFMHIIQHFITKVIVIQ